MKRFFSATKNLLIITIAIILVLIVTHYIIDNHREMLTKKRMSFVFTSDFEERSKALESNKAEDSWVSRLPTKTRQEVVQRQEQDLKELKAHAIHWTRAFHAAETFFYTSLSLYVVFLLSLVVYIIFQRNQILLELKNLKNKLLPQKRRCPFCAEKIKTEAIVCKHCLRDIV
ncbi:zinc ribbon domain-containing protein [Desulfovibrio litoralis]|uniref:Zinc-ribbon domain-containing protein n=1 Tax=Desulfovibrio litoralis DSM 11393 TaxID=1121455 RepID=A0A1M7T8B8_9BACT|nr:zinc ribbon domain-containing protein [Desulfovibrio litoralis]SHN66936.1 hypothetical protein SAMN02745728_01712 [Desulfovibrio litoralis DSM 11393]